MKALLLLFFAAATRVLAMAGTDQLVGEYEPIEKKQGWPAGMFEVLLDPARKVGWHPWFSECPNDVEFYAFAVRTTADAQRLIDLLAKVKTGQRMVVLDPGHGPRGLGEWRPNAQGREWGAQLSFGNPQVLKQWYERLPVGKDGKRRFGVHVYDKEPNAATPTLTIYLGTANMEPAELKIPKGVVAGGIPSSNWPGRDYEKQVEKLKAWEAARKNAGK